MYRFLALLSCLFLLTACDDELKIQRGNYELATVKVELADTPYAQQMGLMYRRDLCDDCGMLFDFKQSQKIGMWMKNTYLSLDMFFIDADGKILEIFTYTEPLSLKTISAGQPVRFVLETKAGFADKHQIQVGDKIIQ